MLTAGSIRLNVRGIEDRECSFPGDSAAALVAICDSAACLPPEAAECLALRAELKKAGEQ